MPSKGRPQLATRVSVAMYEDMLIAIEETNERKEGTPYTVSTWIEMCIAEKLQKRMRGKGLKAAHVPRHRLREEEA